MFLTSITKQQVEELEPYFAVFTSTGWKLPEWLIYLKQVAK